MEMRRIYLDNSATTRICDEALKKYCEVSHSHFGNPSSLHEYGYAAEKELKAAREIILSSVSGKECEVIFTASGSEANNLAIIGRALSKERYKKWGKIITTEGEHASVTSPVERLHSLGFRVAYIPTKNGVLDEGALMRELTEDVVLVTMMMVNNETGALYDIPHVARMMKNACPEAVLHVDATQSYLKIPFTKAGLCADMITLSSHKIEGPKGVGALVVDKKIIKAKGLSPIILGGGQEGGLRSGTENVPGAVAFGEAVRIGAKEVRQRGEKMEDLRSYLIEKINSDDTLSEISLTLPASHAPHILNLTLPNIKSETMLHYLSSEGIFVSSGSACSSNSGHVSSALISYGRSEKEADCSIRVSFSHTNSREDVDALAEALKAGLSRLARIK